MNNLLNKIVCGDCTKVLAKIKQPFADLIFADPPFNIGFGYDTYNDKRTKEDYILWSEEWIFECQRVLKSNGSFYIAIGDEHVSDIKEIADSFNLHLRNWIIWHYSFGQQTKNKFARSHTHILYFVKNNNDFIFHDDDVRIISDRQKKYFDKRANPSGKMPDDVWNEYPRICGTFKERTINIPCQMPESLLARIIRASSDEGNWVMDPFSGSGTTAVVAAKLNRIFTGIEISPQYCKESRERIINKDKPIEGETKRKWTEYLNKELKWLYHENKVPTEQLQNDTPLKILFTDKFNKRIGEKITPFQPDEVIKHLIQLRKSAKLGPLRGEPIKK